MWERLFAEGEVNVMILQPFIHQKVYEMNWDIRNGKYDPGIVRDYVSGTILNVDGNYFGTGLFRTSSSPVINQRDSHKISPVITDQGDRFAECIIL